MGEEDAAVQRVDPRHPADATVGRVTTALDTLVAATAAALDDRSLADDRARAEAIAPAMHELLDAEAPIPADAYQPLDGAAVGNLLHADRAGRFHVLAVVFP